MTLHWLAPAVLAFLGFGLGNAVLKRASHHGEAPAPVLVAIHVAAWATALAWAIGSGLPFRMGSYAIGLVGGLIGFTGLVALYAALAEGVAVKVFPILRLNTLVTVGLAIAILAERPSLVVAAGIAVAIGAMWVLSGSDDNDAAGGGMRWFWLALVTLVTFGTTNFIVEFGAHTAADRVSTIAGLYTLTTVLSVGYYLLKRGRFTRRALSHGAATGVGYVAGFAGLTAGYAAGTVSRVAPFMGLNILIPMGASVAFMGERVTWRVAVGTPLALLAMYLLSVG